MALIAVDADDVLVAHYELLFAHLNATFGSDVGSEDWHVRYTRVGDYARDWGVSLPDLQASVHELLARDDAFAEPLPGAVETLTALGRSHRLVLITARHQQLREATRTWLDVHLPGVFEAVHVLGAERWGDGLLVEKVVTLQEIGASVLIDDSLRHCLAAAEAGLRAVLFGDYGWNRSESLPAGVVRARDWSEVSAAIRSS